MPTPLEYITRRAPEFAARTDISEWISDTSLEVSKANYNSDNMRNKAIALLVCHKLALLNRDSSNIGVSGMVVSEKEGDLSRGYGGAGFGPTAKTGIDHYLSQTTWGVELYNLQQSQFPLIMTRM